MNCFENAVEKIREFYKIKTDEYFEKNIFEVLKQIIEFDAGYINLTNSERPEYLFNTDTSDIKSFESCLRENLYFKNTVYGEIVITGKHYSSNEKKIFKTCACVISDIIKDFEISQITKMQIEAIQQGYLKIHKNTKKIKNSQEAKTKFISHISHELRTPINSILGFSEILGSGFTGKLNSKQKEYIDDIKISSLKLLEMVNEILDISKIEAKSMKLNLQKFSTSVCIQEVVNLINPLLIRKNLNFKKNIGNFEITADYQKFQQILLNLLSNAVKYTPVNGKIILECTKKDDKTIITVEDNGVGIEKKDLKKIFKKYEQADAKANSTGLGLAIAKEFVKMHNGTITAESEIGKGSKFTVVIPLN